MTAWCSSTTSVRKVRARSSEKLRTFAFGIGRTSAAAIEEIVVMGRPRDRLFGADVATGTRRQQRRIVRLGIRVRQTGNGCNRSEFARRQLARGRFCLEPAARLAVRS